MEPRAGASKPYLPGAEPAVKELWPMGRRGRVGGGGGGANPHDRLFRQARATFSLDGTGWNGTKLTAKSFVHYALRM